MIPAPEGYRRAAKDQVLPTLYLRWSGRERLWRGVDSAIGQRYDDKKHGPVAVPAR